MTDEKEFIVYKHTTPNNKVYIGITSQQVDKRWGKNGKGYKKQLFYRAILKYGWNNIKHEILFTHLSKEEAFQKEIDLIAEYKANNVNYGYNISNGGDGIGDDYSYLCVPIDMYDKQGNLLKSFKSITEAEEKTNCSSINQYIRGKNKTSGGFVWRYSTDSFDKYSCNNEVIRSVIQYDMDGNVIAEYNSIAHAERVTKNKGIKNCITGQHKTSGGFIWRYKDDPFDKYDLEYKPKGKIIKQYSLGGTYIKTYSTCEQASYETGINAGHISDVCSGKRLSCGGFVWRYENDNFNSYKTEKEIPLDRRVYQYDFKGNLIEVFKWATDAVKKYGDGVSKCLSGRYKTAYGYIWKREGELFETPKFENPKQDWSYLQYDLNNNLICKYSSIDDIPIPSDKKRNTYLSKIKEAAHGKRKTAYGYIWKKGENNIL